MRGDVYGERMKNEFLEDMLYISSEGYGDDDDIFWEMAQWEPTILGELAYGAVALYFADDQSLTELQQTAEEKREEIEREIEDNDDSLEEVLRGSEDGVSTYDEILNDNDLKSIIDDIASDLGYNRNDNELKSRSPPLAPGLKSISHLSFCVLYFSTPFLL